MEDEATSILGLPSEAAAQFRNRLTKRVGESFEILFRGHLLCVVRQQVLAVSAKNSGNPYDPFAGSAPAVTPSLFKRCT